MSSFGEASKLGEVFYSRHEMYALSWSVDLRSSIVAVAKAGGPVALLRDDRRLVKLGSNTPSSLVQIFTAAGKLLGRFVWDKRGRVAGMGWTHDEVLICMQDDGQCFAYTMRGQALPKRGFSMGSEVADQGVAECIFWAAGAVCRTRDEKLYAVSDFDDPRVSRLADPGITEPPHCMAVVDPKFTVDQSVEVLLAVGSSIIVVDTLKAEDQALTSGPYERLAVAPNGMLLAGFTHDGRLMVFSTDFSKNFSECGTKSTTPPDQLAWCGADSIVLYWEEVFLMVGPKGEWVRYSYEEPSVLVSETDGVRIISESRHDFIRRIPDCIVDVFRPGSTAPAAMLYDALDHFDRRSARADENLRLIGAKLPDAVADCIVAAGHALELSEQRQLLRAAAYGSAYCRPDHRPPKLAYRDMCRTLRILHALRHHEVGLAITYAQFQRFEPSAIISRLLNAHHHLLALRISEDLKLGHKQVLLHWAGCKMVASEGLSDRELLAILLEKLRTCPGFPYAAIAADAHFKGRPRLAAMLLDHEPNASEQVPLLTSMGEEERAVIKAIESGDADLVYLAIFHIWRKKPFQEFVQLIASKPLARDLFCAYCRRTDPELLKSFYYSLGYTQGVAEALMQEAFSVDEAAAAEDLGAVTRRKETVVVGRLLDQSSELYARMKNAFLAKSTDEAAKLLRAQAELERETSRPMGTFINLSLADTILALIQSGNVKAASKLKSEFKVSEKHWCWMQLRALVAKKDWEALDKLCLDRKPPIGYVPFVQLCIEAGAPKHVLAPYIAKLPEPSARVEYYKLAGLTREAEEAETQAAAREAQTFQNKATSFFSQLQLR
mmetsp:Transcript_16747/g.54755  ORF Transcript_16747/g.54755 Transcript_16747/m.54755 type:complete len:834 (-) Transcript_16747:45-2546(-)|eukprot:CAMPEP_0170135692 /NCGR_PEP_ID=MMETSP0033_2-20121228/2606_1 /TAXON_ID=195969 /ORGANISM="Dolichomastix tenuilepis, Strain CCMP3274" /LENGTH=833 /DNA_ID=CAMNT_0010371295 /DNA_START=120 /DNA_END=2621 /DNA_ORIENTATION=-